MKFPQSWSASTVVAKASAPAKVSASSLDMGAETLGQGLCPECKVKMIVATVGDKQVLACVKDRVALPLPNQKVEHEVPAEGA